MKTSKLKDSTMDSKFKDLLLWESSLLNEIFTAVSFKTLDEVLLEAEVDYRLFYNGYLDIVSRIDTDRLFINLRKDNLSTIAFFKYFSVVVPKLKSNEKNP